MTHSSQPVAWQQWVLVTILLGIIASICIVFFMSLPIENTRLGIDNIAYALRPWTAIYSHANDTGFKNPPWTALLLMLPANLLPHQAFWGFIVFCTLLAQVVCIPAAGAFWRRLLAALLLMTCFPAMRNIADANLEFFVIGGTLLLVAGYRRQQPLLLAAGGLFVTAKPQSTSLLLVVLALYLLQTWHWRRLVQAVALAALLIVPAMLWRGQAWLGAVNNYYLMNTLIDMSLDATLRRLGVESSLLLAAALGAVILITGWVCWRSRYDFGREKAGLLIAASILIAPYVGANAPVNFIAIGVIPLFMSRPMLGMILFALINVPYFWSLDQLNYQSNYWTLLALLIWGILSCRVLRHPPPDTPAVQANREIV